MKCLIVEDDKMSRTSLARLCGKIEGVEVRESEGAVQAVKMLSEESFDLIFLDVEMPDMSGIELIQNVGSLPPVVITSGNKKYAYDAFELDVVDYIQKPVSLPRLIKSFNKVNGRDRGQSVREVLEDSLFVKVDGKLVRLELNDIQYIESLRDYVIFRIAEHRFVVHSSLKNIEQKLENDERFLKVHRSFIINLRWIKDVDDKSVVVGERVVPVSRSHRTDLVEKLNLL